MDERIAREIRESFLEWSGGFPPDSKEQVYVYVDAVGQPEVSDADLWIVLQEWMASNDIAQGPFVPPIQDQSGSVSACVVVNAK
jgi:hypothetical protein